MYLCDICSTQSYSIGTLISASKMKKAVFDNGFDPFKLKLASSTSKFNVLGPNAFSVWKSQVVAPDNSDWNICSNCLPTLQKHF